MPKDMPKDMPKKPSAEEKAREFYDLLLMSSAPQKDVKPYMANLQQEYSTRDVQQVLTFTYLWLHENKIGNLAEYLKELYGYGINKKCFEFEVKDRTTEGREKVKEVVSQPHEKAVEQLNAFDGVLSLEAVEKYCIEDCCDYDSVKAIYDMLLELYYEHPSERWSSAKANIKKRMQDLKKGMLNVEVGDGGEFNMEKNVEYEVNHVESGATGVSITKSKGK